MCADVADLANVVDGVHCVRLDARWGTASCTPPRSADTYSAYITALMQRYGSQIAAIEVWNEANLQTFWNGSAVQMADLTQRAYQAVKAVSPNTIVLAASTTTRLAGSLRNAFGPYAAALKDPSRNG